MKYSVKAALSSVALPGAGLFILRHYILGLFFLVPYLAALSYLVILYFNRTLNIMEQAAIGLLPLDINFLVAKILDITDTNTLGWLAVAKWTYILICIFSVIVSGLLGHKRDRQLATQAAAAEKPHHNHHTNDHTG